MKYIALLSGGKDSCFNVMHCSANGHDLVAAVTLGPTEGKEEIDSYMYQTVGQDAVSLVADALDVPLYRGTIRGTAVNMGSDYGSRESSKLAGDDGDETEDLFNLLASVKTEHPEIQGVSVGAILSNYQRVRVEHVCQRLSLTPLCFLWQREQSDLLQEMLDFGLEAILIKVAGIGLTSKHLGKSLGEMQSILLRLESLYGLHVCGEGGEYETLTLDCPLFKRRIVIDETETVIHSDNDFATVAYLRVKAARLEDKEPSQIMIRPPEVLAEEFSQRKIEPKEHLQGSPCGPTPHEFDASGGPMLTATSTRRTGSWVLVNNVYRDPSNGYCSFKEEVYSCLASVRDRLHEQEIPFSRTAHLHVFISDMSKFSDMNAVYGSFFGSSPPARTCVSVDLPAGINIMVDCIAYDESTSSPRISLHVQSLSYWAPANIGPYSQAIIVGGRIFFSGQIGLVPSTLTMPSPQSLGMETALSLQHLHRIKLQLQRTYGVVSNATFQFLAVWIAGVDNLPHVNRVMGSFPLGRDVPTIFLGAKDLPKEALVEVQGMGGYVDQGEDNIDDSVSSVPVFQTRNYTSDSLESLVQITSLKGTGDFSLIATFKGLSNGRQLASLPPDVVEHLPDAVIARLYYIGAGVEAPSVLNESNVALTTIPVQFVSTLSRFDWECAVFLAGRKK